MTYNYISSVNKLTVHVYCAAFDKPISPTVVSVPVNILLLDIANGVLLDSICVPELMLCLFKLNDIAIVSLSSPVQDIMTIVYSMVLSIITGEFEGI